MIDGATIAALEIFPQQLEAYYAAIPDAFKRWAPPSWDGVPSEPFTAIEQVCHVRDVEIEGYHVRLHRTLHEVNPTLPSIDGEALAKERAYATATASDALASFRAARRATLQLIGDLTADQCKRPAFLEGYGSSTLCSLVHYLCSHDQQHLSGLQWLLGKIEA